MNGYEYLIKKRDAMLMAASQFWLASGMEASDVLAAYLFIGVGSADLSRMDLSGNNRTLTLGSQTYSGTSYTPSWNASTGWSFASVYGGNSGYLDNSTLDTLDIKCAIVRFSDATQTNRTCLVTAGGSSGTAQLMSACTYWTDSVVNRTGPGYVHICGSYSGSPKGHWEYKTTAMSEGVLGANFGTSGDAPNGMYKNGSHITASGNDVACSYIGSDTSNKQGYTFGNSHCSKSDLNNAAWGAKKIQCAAFYKRALSVAEHAEIAQKMAAL